MYGVVEQRPAVLLRESPFVYFLQCLNSLSSSLAAAKTEGNLVLFPRDGIKGYCILVWDSNLTRRFKLHEGQSSIASYTAGHLVLSYLIKA